MTKGVLMEVNRLFPVKKNPKVQAFGPGDTVRVHVRVKEGERERVQAFQGVVIETHGKPPTATFTVRRVTYGVGVERTFPLYSPLLESVEVARRGDVRRANLTYLRGRFGRAARIKEKAWSATPATEPPAEETPAEVAVAEAPAPEPTAASPATQPAAEAAQPAAEAAKPEPAQPVAESQPAASVEPKQASG